MSPAVSPAPPPGPRPNYLLPRHAPRSHPPQPRAPRPNPFNPLRTPPLPPLPSCSRRPRPFPHRPVPQANHPILPALIQPSPSRLPGPSQPVQSLPPASPSASPPTDPLIVLTNVAAQARTNLPPSGPRRHHQPLYTLMLTPCPSCSLPARFHLRGASLLLSSRLQRSATRILHLLKAWLSTTSGWIHLPASPPPPEDITRLLVTLHILHTEALSLADHQSSDTSPSSISPGPLTPSLAAKGVGPAGWVPIPHDIWISTAPGGLLLADAITPPLKASPCPLLQSMLDSLLSAGLLALHPGLPNAEAFVKRKSPSKAALIINMQALNGNCPCPPPKFRLPTLLEIGFLLLSTRSPSQSACIATLDLANCFWSIRLPTSNVGCIRIGTPLHTYTLLSLPFGWTHAPAMAQRVIHRHLHSLPLSLSPRAPPHTVQYLDDILFLAASPATLSPCVSSAVAGLQSAGFLLSPKSILEPQPTALFIGKLIDLPNGTISSQPAYLASVVLQWLSLATSSFTRKKASRLLGKLVWIAQPRRRIHPFLAGPYAALRFGPSHYPSTSQHLTRSTLEALAMAFPAWRAFPTPSTPSPSARRYFADAARSPWGLFFCGIWEPNMGLRFFPCPNWVLSQQAAELFAAVKALSLAAHRGDLSIHLYLDNHAAIYSILRGKARSPLIPQNRLLRRLNYLLVWSGITAAVHYVPSHLNPADPPSRWWSFPCPLSLVSRTWILGLSNLLGPPGSSWGLLAGPNRTM